MTHLIFLRQRDREMDFTVFLGGPLDPKGKDFHVLCVELNSGSAERGE
mgnify:CR=1 FL=1